MCEERRGEPELRSRVVDDSLPMRIVDLHRPVLILIVHIPCRSDIGDGIVQGFSPSEIDVVIGRSGPRTETGIALVLGDQRRIARHGIIGIRRTDERQEREEHCCHEPVISHSGGIRRILNRFAVRFLFLQQSGVFRIVSSHRRRRETRNSKYT